MQRLAIIGSGDLAGQIAHHALATGLYRVAGLFDDFETPGTPKHNSVVLGSINDVNYHFNTGEFDVLMLGIGYKHIQKRAEIFNTYLGKIPYAKIIHPSCTIDQSAYIGEGAMIYPGCIIDYNCHIAPNVLIYTGCTISHDVHIGNHTMLAPAVKTSGFVKIGEQVILGTGTVISDNIYITDRVRTGAGSVIVDNLSQPGLYYGVPAKLKTSKQ